MAKGAGGGRSNPATPSYRRSSLLLLSLSLLVLSPLILSPVRGDHHGDRDGESGDGRVDKESAEVNQGPDPAERAIGITGLTSRWDAIKTWAKLAWMNFRPPESWRDSSAVEVMKEAATRSFDTGKETVLHTAESAAKVAEEAMHKTKEKVKRTVSRPEGNPDAEL